jgi:hypothetical protein
MNGNKCKYMEIKFSNLQQNGYILVEKKNLESKWRMCCAKILSPYHFN